MTYIGKENIEEKQSQKMDTTQHPEKLYLYSVNISERIDKKDQWNGIVSLETDPHKYI